MQAKDLVLDKCRQGQVVEQVGEELPHVGVAVFAQAFVVKAVHLRDLTGLMVAPEDCNALGIPDFQRH